MEDNKLKPCPFCGEIKDLERIAADTVAGCSPEVPYAKHTISIRGYPPDMLERQSRLLVQKREIEQFVEGLEDSRLRRIVRLRVMEGLTWAQVAARMGHRYSENSVKKQYLKIFSD